MLRALIHALAAQTALLKVDVCQVVLKRDCLKRAGLDALSATDATNLASLLGYRTLILVNATYIDTAVQLVLVTQFYDHARAGLDAGTACGTFVLIHNRQTGLRIHLDGIELTCFDAIAASQTTIETSGCSAIHQRRGSTALRSVLDTQTGTVGA